MAASTTTSSIDTSPASDGKPDISWQRETPTEPGPSGSRLEDELLKRSSGTDVNVSAAEELTVPFKELLPGKQRSQSGIASRAFLLGQTFAVSLLLAYYAFNVALSPLWRPPFFLSTLALFHFLEFWTHARYNVPKAYVNTFLLFNNGLAYQAAHGSSMLETTITSIYFPQWQSHFSSPWVQCTGLLFIFVGQILRSLAMATAGKSFNHRVQHRRAVDHELVTNGIYRFLRHPSYFGFFWWAVGTQMVLGNFVCFFVYVIVLWRFFSARIKAEEKHLVQFFGDSYVQYRASTRVGIPFIP